MTGTYNKATIKAVREYCFKKYGDIETDGQIALKTDIIAFKKSHGIKDTYKAIYQFTKEGNIDAYGVQKRLALMDILNQDPDYAGQFTDDQVDNLYCHLIARDLTSFYKDI